MTERIRVLVVDDSLTVRRHLCEVLSSDPAISVVGEASDGKEAIERCARLRPDVLTMDMMMPVMSGLAATEYIMAHFPTPIVIVSASVNRGELFKTYDALAAGAVDVLDKPAESDAAWEARFVATVKLVSRLRVITHLRGRLRPRPSTIGSRTPGTTQVVAIGASTGGPNAVVEVLKGLTPAFRIPVLLVMHINRLFADALAEWLDAQTPRRVRYAVDGEPVAAAAGTVLVAPADVHMIVRGGRLRLTTDAERHSCRPSVDVLFESIAIEYGSTSAACLLTGMGRDGATGLLAIRQAGGLAIAQDEATSVVYGMPREAAAISAAEQILPLGEIAPVLAELAKRGGG
jgi:two-component system chemotaxis response regulator CheB